MPPWREMSAVEGAVLNKQGMLMGREGNVWKVCAAGGVVGLVDADGRCW